jgi:SP family sugar:H+ symporter-like MFS transporter
MMRRLWGPSVDLDATIAEIRRTVSTRERPLSKNLRKAGARTFLPVVWLGIALAFFQQASGINAVMYFGEYLWAAAGFSERNGLLINVTLGAVLVVSTLVSMVLVDRIGRRPLLLAGSAVMSTTLLVLATPITRSSSPSFSGLFSSRTWRPIRKPGKSCGVSCWAIPAC